MQRTPLSRSAQTGRYSLVHIIGRDSGQLVKPESSTGDVGGAFSAQAGRTASTAQMASQFARLIS
jgi:hypothetical protein